MPIITGYTRGIANANSGAAAIPIPAIPRQGARILSVSAVRTLGRLLTDGDQVLVALSHQNDVLSADLGDDPDDIIDPDLTALDLWWVHGLSETDHVHDHLTLPQEVAGPQSIIVHNGSGATTAVRVDLTVEFFPIPSMVKWTLLKRLTSYERNL